MEIEPENELTPLLFGWGLGGAVLLMGLTAAWRLGGFRRHRNDLAADQVEALRAMLHADGSQATSSVDRMLEAIHRTVSLQLARQLNAQFTHRELEVLRGVAQGERAKDTAERLGVGSKSIYMTRTEIRKKLRLHSTDRLEDWLSELSKSTTAP